MLGRRRRFGWPPIKAPQTENGRDFSPFSSSGVFMSSFGHFHVFSLSPSYFYEFHGCFEEFSSLDQSFGSLETQGVVSSHLQVRARTNPRSSRGSDPRNRGV
ncbi:hypothetical protein MANES_01G048130v8 [Manihot esculenta]|uniref:Uncharacterized protein n=1 Tax=Manihot esculenta TaxID=3983 RepID=A0ACB7IAG4_MANES|nr:hypothetical protein MANES_01G048130v8 [Manihot esculenta]